MFYEYARPISLSTPTAPEITQPRENTADVLVGCGQVLQAVTAIAGQVSLSCGQVFTASSCGTHIHSSIGSATPRAPLKGTTPVLLLLLNLLVRNVGKEERGGVSSGRAPHITFTRVYTAVLTFVRFRH